MKVVLALGARESKEPSEEFKKWDISLVESDGKESGPAFGWKFSDPASSTGWIYSYPKKSDAQYTGIKIEGEVFAMPTQQK